MATGASRHNADVQHGDAMPGRPVSQLNQVYPRVRRNRMHRTNTMSGVTDQARKVLEELLIRGTQETKVVKKEIPFSAPTPYFANGGTVFPVVSSPLSDDDPDRYDGAHKRKPSHGISTVLGDSSPSPVEYRVPDEIITRKKKSFFVRAKERLRENIRRKEKHPLTLSADNKATISDGKKKTWSISLRKKNKKNKEDEEGKENGDFKSSGVSKDYVKNRSGETKSSRISLPTGNIDSERTAVPARSRSAVETRLRSLKPGDEAILLNYFSTDRRGIASWSNSTTTSATSTTLPGRLQSREGHHSLRKTLHLEGLKSSYSAWTQATKAPLAIPEDSHITTDEEDATDGIGGPGVAQQFNIAGVGTSLVGTVESSWMDRPLTHATSKPFNEKSEEERNELFSRIAEQLDVIGDNYVYGPSNTNQKEETSVAESQLQHSRSGLTRIPSTSSLSDMANAVGDLMRNTTYDTFHQVVNRTIGSDPGIQQIAAMFRMTKHAVQLVGYGTSTAGKIKEMAIQYFAENFAGWMVDEGGWESVVEDSATDMELD